MYVLWKNLFHLVVKLCHHILLHIRGITIITMSKNLLLKWSAYYVIVVILTTMVN